MSVHLRTDLLLATFLIGSITMAFATTENPTEDCGDVQHNVENGMIRLPEFSAENIKDLNCSWTYSAPQGRKLLVKVDSVHLPPTDLRSSLFQLYIDDELYDIPRNCVKCLREMVGGKTIRVLFSSFVVPFAGASPSNSTEASTVSADGIGSFQVRYKSFDPHRCSKPEQIENGHIISKGRKIGQSIFYRCNPPYDLFGLSEVRCVVPQNSPVPEWNNKAPKCDIQDCSNGPITKEASSGLISSPGYPTYIHEFTEPCTWIITSQRHQQIKASITYLQLPKQTNNTFSENSSRLSLIDGDSTSLVNLTESISNGPLNFTTFSNRLTVNFLVNNEDNKRKEEIGFLLEYSTISSSCPKARSPANGEVIAYSTDLGAVVTYSCDKGFVLVGEMHVECLHNGQWGHPPPVCEPAAEAPLFVAASNDSDTVTARLRGPLSEGGAPAKPSRAGKKRPKELGPSKKPTSAASKEGSSGPSAGETRTGKENGPKSEPHLFQVIPSKQAEKKTPGDSTNLRNSKPTNDTKPDEKLPELDDGLEGESTTKRHPLITVTMISVIAGVGAPLLVALIFLIAIMIYRRRYPVRMRFGRKFSTFENPMYVTKDAHHPRELKRLTT